MTHFYPKQALQGQARALEDVGLAAQEHALRRQLNGEVDLEFYLNRGRDERALAAQQLFRKIGGFVVRILTGRLNRKRLPQRHARYV